MEDTSSNIKSKYHTVKVPGLREMDLDCAPDLLNGWQSDLKLGDCMLQMFDASLWTDISFRCSDQSEENLDDRIHAHKIVLASRSPVFQAMFFGPCKDGNRVIEIQDAESQDFKLFLRLLYSDRHGIVGEYDELTSVLEIAHKYQCTSTVDKCCGKLAKRINEENACAILERALLFDNKYLLKEASDFIDANADKILHSDAFLNTSVTCLAYILKGDTFFTEESEIFERAIEWAKQKCESTDGPILRGTLGDAFFYLRTPCMPLKDFVACTHRKGYYSVEEYEDVVAFMGISEQMKTKCNSTKQRFPLDLEIKRLPLEKEKSNVENVTITDISISETISIDPVIDLYLTSVTLICRNDFVHPGNLSFQRLFGTSTENRPNLFSMRNLPVSVSLELGDTTLKFEVSAGPTKPCMEFAEPFLLSAGKSVTLKIDVKLDKIPDFQLRASKCFTPYELPTTVPGTVFVKTREGSARVVHSLKFKCVNNRM